MRSGCAPDLPLFAAVLDVPFRVEDTCAATGAAIHVDFVPDGVERVDPPTTVVPLLPVDHIRGVTGASFEQVDADVCAYQPFFASAPAAAGWLNSNPGGRIFTVAEMFQRPWHQYLRDSLRPLIHPRTRLSA
jgi:alkylmercury lyase